MATLSCITDRALACPARANAILGDRLLLLLLLLFTGIELSLGGSSPYTGTDKTNKNKYT